VMSIVGEASQPPQLCRRVVPGHPPGNTKKGLISGSPRHGGRGFHQREGGWTFVAAQRVPGTPKLINGWLKGTISVPEIFLMPFKEISEEDFIKEYSPENFETGVRRTQTS